MIAVPGSSESLGSCVNNSGEFVGRAGNSGFLENGGVFTVIRPPDTAFATWAHRLHHRRPG